MVLELFGFDLVWLVVDLFVVCLDCCLLQVLIVIVMFALVGLGVFFVRMGCLLIVWLVILAV